MVKNIIKRIIVGVGIALVLMAIKGNLLIGANAKEISSVDTGGIVQNVTNLDTGVNFVLGGGYWNNWGPGYLHFTFSVNKVSGSSTSPVVMPRSAIAESNNTQYICNIGTIESANSTFSGSVYSATCPMNMGSNGLYRIYIRLFDNQQNSQSTYRFVLTNAITFETADSNQVNIDISSINNKTQQQIDNDNANTNKIIQSQNQINNSINSEESPDTDSFLDDITPDYSNNPVSDLITMPITFLQTLNNNSSGSCVSWDLGSLLGTNLTMPCIDLNHVLGSRLYNLIDMAICLFLAYNLGLMCVTIWNNITSLKDDFDNMYAPKGYPMEQIRSDD